MIDRFSKTRFLITFTLMCYLVTACNLGFAQKNSESRTGLNVTQDMIDLLLNNTTESSYSAVNETKSNISNTLTEPPLQKSTTITNNKAPFQLPPVFLEDKTLPEGNVLYTYDITPWIIQQGHVTTKIPCNEDSLPTVNVLVGKMPTFKSLDLNPVPEFSHPGEQCLYQSKMILNQTGGVSEVLLSNNSSEDIEFPATTSLSVSIFNLTDGN